MPIGACKEKHERKRIKDQEDCEKIIDFLNEALGKDAEALKEAGRKSSEAGLTTA